MRYILSVIPALLLLLVSACSKTEVYEFSPSLVGELDGALVELLKDGQLADVDSTVLSEKKYVFVYYAASWCSACRNFNPMLVDFYKKLYGENDFEFIYVSIDNTMPASMRGAKMPWLGLKSGHSATKALMKYKKRDSVPWLVLLDRRGKVICDPSSEGGFNVAAALNAYVEIKKKQSAEAQF